MDWGLGEAALGSADHAVYTVDLRKRELARTLHGRRGGRAEWVTAVQHLPATDGLVSAGMDGKLCLSDRARARCKELTGHRGSISQASLALCVLFSWCMLDCAPICSLPNTVEI